MLILRRITFLVFATIYIFLCPLIIMYAFGYIFSPNAAEGIVKTGLVSLSTIPSGASIYMEGRRFAYKTPSVIRDLLPGDYYIELSLKNYQPWQKKIRVKGGKAAVFDKVILLPKNWGPQVLIPSRFEEMIPIIGSRFIVLTTGLTLDDYFVYDWKRAQISPLLKNDSSLRNFKVISCFTVKESNFLFIDAVYRGEERYLWVELGDKENKIKDISQFFISRPKEVKWDVDDPNNLFILVDDYLNRLNLGTENLYFRYIENVSDYALEAGWVYLRKGNEHIMRIDYEKKKQEALQKDSKMVNTLFSAEQAFPAYKESHILSVDNSRVYLTSLQEKDRQPYYLFNIKKRSRVYYSEPTGKLYFLDAESGYLSAVEIIPEWELFSLPR